LSKISSYFFDFLQKFLFIEKTKGTLSFPPCPIGTPQGGREDLREAYRFVFSITACSCYETKEFKIPTTNTSTIHKVSPVKTVFLEDVQPSREASTTGTPTTTKKDTAIKANTDN